MVLLALIAVCLVGVEARIHSPHIVGGDDVSEPGTWPWQGILQFRSSGSLTCGSILLSDIWVLCAAHCTSQSPSNYQVQFGVHDRVTLDQGKPMTYLVQSITRHPDYAQDGSRGFPNDIAVIRLASPIDPNRFTSYATLPPLGSTQDFVGLPCYITGWGRTTGGGVLPNILQEASINVMTQAACVARWSQVSNIHICLTDEANQSKGACNGDSGGPLVCNTGTSGSPVWTLAGITSWGRSGCLTTWPSVYVRVTTFRQWIFDQTAI